MDGAELLERGVASPSGALLDVRGLSVTFNTPTGPVPAVRSVDISVDAGETVAIVGESGSGKSTSVLSMLGLIRPGLATIDATSVEFESRKMPITGRRSIGSLLGRRIGVIFQDPQSSLNPTMRIGEQVGESLAVHRRMSKRDVRERVLTALDEVGIPDPVWCAKAHPHQLSGGMRQRVMIAMATIGDPSLLVADEPTTALDVTLQSQIVEVLLGLQQRHGTAIVFITHDLSLVSGFADRTMVMYAGQVVERDDTASVVGSPAHPYTRALIASVPRIGGDPVRPIVGRPPDPRSLPAACAFSPRCPHAVDRCREQVPEIMTLPGGGVSRCWRSNEELVDVS